MVEPLLPVPSSGLGNAHQESAILDLLCTIQAREGAPSSAHEQRMGGLESRDAQQQSSSVGGYGSGTLLTPDKPTAGQDPWIRRCVSEKHTQRQQQAALEAKEQRGSPSEVPGRGNTAPKMMQRAHSERLQMVGAVDKTEMRGGVVDQIQSAALLAQEAIQKRTHWDFANLPSSSTGSKRSMTLGEVRLIQSIGQAVICTDLQGNISCWNQAAESIYLWRADEVLGQNVTQLLSPKTLKKDLIEVIGRVSHGESWSGPYPALRKDGVVISTVVTDTPIVDNNNKIIGIISVSFDVSSLPGVKTTIRRSQSDEGIINESDKEKITPTGSADGKNMLSWRRVHLETKIQGEDTLPDAKSTADGSSNFLRVGRASVQQLLRKLTIGTGQRQGDFTQFNSELRESPREELGSDYGRRGPSQSISSVRTVEHSQTFPVYVPNDGADGDSGEGDGSSLPLVVHSKHHTAGESGSCDSSGLQEVVKEIMGNSLVVPHIGISTQSLSRSSSGSAPGSAIAADASSIGSPIERGVLDNLWTGTGTGLNFQQAEEDFQLQLALALRVAAEAAAVDDPDLVANVRGPKGNTKLMPGISKMEATAYRYWVSSCLGYDDRVEDGFYEVWGMSPYVWSMCTDSNELGRMPPLEKLQAVPPTDSTFEVVLVDRNTDRKLSELEDKAVGLAYESTDVLDMASELAKMVANFMGGLVRSDDLLEKEWQTSSNKLMQTEGTIVLPIGLLRIGLSRHRALLFKVLSDSVGLACRLVRGSAFSGKDNDASVVVKCGDDKEWMIDLMVNPGTRMSPDKRLAPPPTVIPSPLQFERMNPFAGSSVSVLHWTRGEPKSRDSAGGSPQRNKNSDPMRNVGSPARMNDGDMPLQHGLDFAQADDSQGANNKARGYDDDREKYGLVNLLERRGLTGQADLKIRSTDVGEGNFYPENAKKSPDLKDKLQKIGSDKESESPGEEGDHNYERAWAREGRRATGSDDSGKASGPGRMLDQIASESSDFEITWEDVIMGERIGQGSYGKVYRADWQGSDVAVKVFLDQDLKTEALEEFKSEVAIMRRLRHPNIVLFMGAVTKPPNLSIITEFCPRGSLYRLLHRPNRELDDRKRIRMAVDVAKGMNYLHRCSPPVVHRDLKSPNLLVDKNWTVKVGDFGLSRQKHSTFLSSKSSAGTPEWMAPEVLRNEPSDEKSDVYSFGVILWELATLQVPWNGMNPIQVVGAVGFQHRRLVIPDHIDSSIASIIQACWRTDTKSRPSFADLMQELRLLQQRPLSTQSPQPSSPNTQQPNSGQGD
ncbi:unnamed protein product [Calypogeia fissa]